MSGFSLPCNIPLYMYDLRKVRDKPGSNNSKIQLFRIFISLLHCVQLLSHVLLFVTASHQAPLSFTICWSLLKFMSIESVVLSNQPILCCPLLLLPSVFPSLFLIYRQHISYLTLWNKISQKFMPRVFHLLMILWGSRWRAEKFSGSYQGLLVGLWSPADNVVAALGPHDLR